ncbi:hypothetical protein MUO32_29055 [Shinella sp. CPCC 101442]|uniref:hypothetical protein n=1 Tax=Shinella sp. CPCC 101442 TaxID=2932265 RepID=UPI0021534ACD|nr:hypothetical protein [Shinella sp. CPCC 101442]MCR6503071.1 hypothetical protein [Shinella sp. CPCC 101442]
MDIHSHEGAGPIRFGMAREEVLHLLAAEADSFKRNPTDVHPCDHFISLGCFVYYADRNGLFEVIEFSAPAKPTLNGVDLLNVGFIDLLDIIRDADPQVSIDTEGFTSVRLGIGGWAPFLKSAPNSSVETIIVFAPGYYD